MARWECGLPGVRPARSAACQECGLPGVRPARSAACQECGPPGVRPARSAARQECGPPGVRPARSAARQECGLPGVRPAGVTHTDSTGPSIVGVHAQEVVIHEVFNPPAISDCCTCCRFPTVPPFSQLGTFTISCLMVCCRAGFMRALITGSPKTVGLHNAGTCQSPKA